MDLGSIFLILALLVLVVLFISRPFFIRKGSPGEELVAQVDHERSNLLAEWDRILSSIQELDFDFTLGKVPEVTYKPQRLSLIMRGTEVLHKLDSFFAAHERDGSELAEVNWERKSAGGQPDATDEEAKFQSGATSDGEIRHIVNTKVCFPDDDLELLLAERRRYRHEKSTGFCSSCGDPVRKSDRYCPKCGAKIG